MSLSMAVGAKMCFLPFSSSPHKAVSDVKVAKHLSYSTSCKKVQIKKKESSFCLV